MSNPFGAARAQPVRVGLDIFVELSDSGSLPAKPAASRSLGLVAAKLYNRMWRTRFLEANSSLGHISTFTQYNPISQFHHP